jgi:transcriptional regulator with XRE-family HTH domain
VSSDPGALAEYMRARRSQLRPEDVGLPADSGRRVRGLRRAEVAALAHISAQYYTRLEQGRTHQPSASVLSGLVRALALDEYSAAYFYRLANPAPPAAAAAAASPPVSELVREVVGRWSGTPVHVMDRNQDLVLANDLALAMFPHLLSAGNNVVLSVFEAGAEDRQHDIWKGVAQRTVAALRYHGDPADPRLREIVGQLSVRDVDFRRMWADHQARPLDSGVVLAPVDGVGLGPVPWQQLEIPGGFFMIVYLSVPGEFSGTAIEHVRRRLEASAALHDDGSAAAVA